MSPIRSILLCWAIFLSSTYFWNYSNSEDINEPALPFSSLATTSTLLHQSLRTGDCFDTGHTPEWWVYMWCAGLSIRQLHYDHVTRKVESNHLIGSYMSAESTPTHEIYRNDLFDCWDENLGKYQQRYSEVAMECCAGDANINDPSSSKSRNFNLQRQLRQQGNPVAVKTENSDRLLNLKLDTYIDNVVEPVPCTYYFKICRESLCPSYKSRQSDHDSSSSDSGSPLVEVAQILDEIMDTVISPSDAVKFEEPISDDWINVAHKDFGLATTEHQENLKQRVIEMFYKSYDAYMENALPEGELRPITCEGAPFDLIKIPLVTLIDALDTLVIMGNHSEFRKAVTIVLQQYSVRETSATDSFNLQNKINSRYSRPGFALNVNVSVFETTIRILGGLLSAHLFAIDSSLGIYADKDSTSAKYDGGLLTLAIDIGNRLLPAFRTRTGIPYGTVNLKFGVPKDETEIASVAGAGSLLVEFRTLSILSGDHRYEQAASRAVRALHKRRSSLGLVGKHIHITSGKWSEAISGIGSNSDSYYEYLIKAYLMESVSSSISIPAGAPSSADSNKARQNISIPRQSTEMLGMFSDSFAAIKKHIQVGDWFGDVDMNNGKVRRNRVENLHAFWPGVEALLGFTESSSALLNAFYSVWDSMGFLPEEFDQTQWLEGKSTSQNGFYPLRPELIESTYYHYRTTADRTWLSAGEQFLENIELLTDTGCGYASVMVANGAADGNAYQHATHHQTINKINFELIDMMPSFFLSETCKYLYLLFDEDNFIHNRPYIFSTEAHPFDLSQLYLESQQHRLGHSPPAADSRTSAGSSGIGKGAKPKHYEEHPYSRYAFFLNKLSGSSKRKEILDPGEDASSEDIDASQLFVLPSQCPRRYWWDPSTSFYISYRETSATMGAHPKRSSSSRKPRRLSVEQERRYREEVANNARQSLRYGTDPASDNILQQESRHFTDKSRKLMWSFAHSIAVVENLGYEDIESSHQFRDMLELGNGLHDLSSIAQQPTLGSGSMKESVSIHECSVDCDSKQSNNENTNFQWLADDMFYKSMDTEPQPQTLAAGTASKTQRHGLAQGLGRGQQDSESFISSAIEASLTKAPLISKWRRDGRDTCLVGEAASWEILSSSATSTSSTVLHAGDPTARGSSSRRGNLASKIKEPVVQQLQVHMGDLGDFSVVVSADLFQVRSIAGTGKGMGETIEISGVGESLVFAREILQIPSRKASSGNDDVDDEDDQEANNDDAHKTSTEIRTVLGDSAGQSFRCSVELLDPVTEEATWSSACSSSTFAPRSMEPITLNIVFPSDDNTQLCRPLLSDYVASSNAASAEVPADVQKSADAVTKAREKHWWSWQNFNNRKSSENGQQAAGLSSDFNRNKNDDSETSDLVIADKSADSSILNQQAMSSSPGLSYSGKGVVGMRGNCMFEEKARVVQNAGGAALIISNTEESLFIMSGKHDSEDMPDGPVTIPVVMIALSDSMDLMNKCQDLTRGNKNCRARISLSSLPSFVDSELYGDYSFPKLFVRPNIISAVGHGHWALLLLSPSGTGKDWQLYITLKHELLDPGITSYTVYTSSGQQVLSTTSLFDSSASYDVRMYQTMISQRCPSHVFPSLDNGNVLVRL